MPFHPPIGYLSSPWISCLHGHNIFRASWLQVTTYFNSISQERLQHKERGRFIARASVLWPAEPGAFCVPPPQKPTALGRVRTLVIPHQECFSGYDFQTLFRHLQHLCLPKASHFRGQHHDNFQSGQHLWKFVVWLGREPQRTYQRRYQPDAVERCCQDMTVFLSKDDGDPDFAATLLYIYIYIYKIK